MFFDVLRCIVIDFFQPVSYLLVIFAAGVLAAGFLLGIRRVTGWRIRFQISVNGLCRVLLLVYLLVLLQTALFSREPGSRYSLDLTLFETCGRSAVSAWQNVPRLQTLPALGSVSNGWSFLS